MAILTVYPSSVMLTYGTSSDADNGCAPHTNTSYATIESVAMSESMTSVKCVSVGYVFDLTSLPDDVIINSISCVAKGYANIPYSEMIAKYRLRLLEDYNQSLLGTTLGEANMPTSGASNVTISCATTTREKLNKKCALQVYTGGSSLAVKSYAYFYGATLTIDYTEPQAFTGYANIGGVNKELSGGYANIGGTWKELVGGYINIGGVWKEMS